MVNQGGAVFRLFTFVNLTCAEQYFRPGDFENRDTEPFNGRQPLSWHHQIAARMFIDLPHLLFQIVAAGLVRRGRSSNRATTGPACRPLAEKIPLLLLQPSTSLVRLPSANQPT